MDTPDERMRYMLTLAEKFPTVAAASSEIIRIEALLRLPKGTEHFMSDLHGEHEAFLHILNNASGVIREKIEIVLGDRATEQERSDLATLVYYPEQKLPELKKPSRTRRHWPRGTAPRCYAWFHYAALSPVSIRAAMCAPAFQRAAAIFWMSCSMPILRITIRISTMAKLWTASSATGARTPTSSASVS